MFRLKLEFPRLFLAQESIIKILTTQQKVCLIPGNLLGVLTAKLLEDFVCICYFVVAKFIKQQHGSKLQ